jgi:hypothetical protein
MTDEAQLLKHVHESIALIKARMPKTYASIQAKAETIGNDAFGHVRAGLRGVPDRFWAMEAGYVVGTPFRIAGIQDTVANSMVQFGCTHAVIWREPASVQTSGVNHGTH